MKISIGSDHGGLTLKNGIVSFLEKKGIEVKDFGTSGRESCDYPDYALKVAESVAFGGADLGILICTTGIGMAIAANKVPGIRAALCKDRETARLSREHNDANVLALDGRLDETTALGIAETWIESGSSSAEDNRRHMRRIEKINEIERKYSRTPDMG